MESAIRFLTVMLRLCDRAVLQIPRSQQGLFAYSLKGDCLPMFAGGYLEDLNERMVAVNYLIKLLNLVKTNKSMNENCICFALCPAVLI